MMQEKKTSWFILLSVVGIAGLTQGLLLPLIATLLEREGVSSSMNGLNAAALYVGIFVMTPFCGPLVRRWGYKKIIMSGMIITTGATFLFPWMDGFFSWMVLRFFIGIGDSILNFAAQLWITVESSPQMRGRRIGQYGLAFGMGFGLGPLGMNLLVFGEAVPFLAQGVILLLALLGVSRLSTQRPDSLPMPKRSGRTMVRVVRLSALALCPIFLYGFLEATLSGSFPIYGLREGLGATWVSVLISAFIYGSLLFQVPLGILSDRWGRKEVLTLVCLLGAVGMLTIPFAISHPWLLLLLFTFIGGLLGSLFSLGLAYMTDLLPREDLPEANALAGAFFALGCVVGPYTGGVLIQTVGGGSLFYLLAFSLFFFVMLTQWKPQGMKQDRAKEESY